MDKFKRVTITKDMAENVKVNEKNFWEIVVHQFKVLHQLHFTVEDVKNEGRFKFSYIVEDDYREIIYEGAKPL